MEHSIETDYAHLNIKNYDSKKFKSELYTISELRNIRTRKSEIVKALVTGRKSQKICD